MAADSDRNGPSSSIAITLPRWLLIQYHPPYLMGSPESLPLFQILVVLRFAKNTFTPDSLTVCIKKLDSLTVDAPLGFRLVTMPSCQQLSI